MRNKLAIGIICAVLLPSCALDGGFNQHHADYKLVRPKKQVSFLHDNIDKGKFDIPDINSSLPKEIVTDPYPPVS